MQEKAMAMEGGIDVCYAIDNQTDYNHKVIYMHGTISADPHYNMIMYGDKCDKSISVSAVGSLRDSEKFKALQNDIFKGFPHGKKILIHSIGEFNFYPGRIPSRVFIMRDFVVGAVRSK
jgi:hypothetical protein